MKTTGMLAGLVAATLVAAPAHSAEPRAAVAAKPDPKQIERGRYVLTVGSCNDCHTAGFAPANGNVPEKEWLLGDSTIGLRGPWGTTYATNLRLSLSRMTENQWVAYARELKARPPMPWFNLKQWTETDLRAFYQYVRHLGPAGQPAPQALPPGQAAKTPVIQWPAAPGGK